MSANVSTTGTISINQIQPKFKDCLLNSKTKAHLRSWIKLIGGIVCNIKNGPSLGDFLDYYLKRNTKECNTAPNFLQEEALQIGNTEDPNVTPTRTSSSPSVESENARFSVPTEIQGFCRVRQHPHCMQSHHGLL